MTRRTPVRVLVVDDEPDVMGFIKLMLSRAPGIVVETADPSRAIELMKANLFDVVLTDFNMPQIGAAALIRELKAIHASVAVIVMSGSSARAAALAAGAAAFLEKPFQQPDLLEVLKLALADDQDVETLKPQPPPGPS